MYILVLSLNPADEIFLTEEIKHLKKKFNVIFISRDREEYDNLTIESGEGIQSYVIDDPHSAKGNWTFQLILSVFKPEVWKEIAYIIKRKTLTPFSVKKILYYSASSAIDSRNVTRILKDAGLTANDKAVFYAYRMNTGALSVLKVKKYFKNAKCIARAHGIDLYEYRQKDNYLPFRRTILKNLESLYCIALDGKNYISKYGCRNVEVSRLGTKDHGIEQETLKTADHIPFIVSCSRVAPEKRIEKIIDALSLIDDDIRWVHIGSGDKLDALRKYADEKLSGKPNVRYELVGNMANDEVARYYSEHYIDGFVNVSTVEGIPVSIMEACSFGIPIIATDVGGTGEIVKDGYNGYLLPSDFNDEQLASTIASLIKDKKTADQLRQNSRKEWEDNFDEYRNYELFADEVSRLYD